ncbi:fetuin-B-like [Hyperolius riggenbachi]|uniref:fetuin-B-like n=1 Tax=Hyperolius riggenbachi TaxID=752182 RepID=UPI0035A2D3AF
MGRVCALVVCFLVSLCSATSPPKPLPILTPLNCNESTVQTDISMDLINEHREEGFALRPVRTKAIYEQVERSVPGAAVYYVDVDVIETGCHVLSGKGWKDCNKEVQFHELVFGECKAIVYIARPMRILKLLNYKCTLTPVPSSTIVQTCPDCPVIVKEITLEIKTKAAHLVEKFNKESNETKHFKLDNIERVRTQWVFGQSYFFYFTIKETECLKTQADVNIENCKTLHDHEAHVGFCIGSVWNTPEKTEGLSVNCEIYNPRDDDHHHPHHHGHGKCGGEKEGAQVDATKGTSDVPGADEAGTGEATPGEADKHRDHKHHCHPGHHHHHRHHPGHHDHHHDHPGHHHHHHHHHDSKDPTQQHDHHHHDHKHNDTDHGSSSEESTGAKPFKKPSKGSVDIYYDYDGTKATAPPVPTITRSSQFRRHLPWKHMPETVDFPNEPPALQTCPEAPRSDVPARVRDYMFV